MPEGDTIFRAANTLQGLIEGRTIRHASAREDSMDASSLVGRTLTSIEARGKHLLMHLDDGRVIHTHMGMHGAWHTYWPGQSWQKSEASAELVLQFDETVAVCFMPKVLELLTPEGLQRHPWLSRLGPDLLAAKFDEVEALARLRIHNATAIGEAIMNQSIVSGIGNVYKSETLFLTGIHPLAKVGQLSDEELKAILTRARTLMRRNLAGFPRVTRFRDGPKKSVYGRAGEPCLKCGSPVQVTRQGDLGRTTYFCPSCQQARAE